jgi:hypothetical protein
MPLRRNEELLYSNLQHLQAKTERAPILPTNEAAITQKKEAKENSQVHDQRSNWKHVLDKYFTLGKLLQGAAQQPARCKIRGPLRQQSSNSRFKDVSYVWPLVYTFFQWTC